MLGVPCVASKISGLVDAVQDKETGLLVPPQDPDQLEQALQKLLENDEFRRSLGRQARERALRDFDQSVVNRNVLAEYQRIHSQMPPMPRFSSPACAD